MLSKKSFTLIEMLLVTSLMAMIGLALYQSLVNGLKVWEVANRYSIEEDTAIFLDKISQDLRNAINYSLIQFDGKDDKMSFATIVKTMSDPRYSHQPGYIPQVGRVEYEFDKLTNAVVRRQANYGQAMAGEFDPPRPLVHSIRFVKFSYYFLESDQMVAKDKADGQWPISVLVEVGFGNNPEKFNTMSKSITIPWGNTL